MTGFTPSNIYGAQVEEVDVLDDPGPADTATISGDQHDFVKFYVSKFGANRNVYMGRNLPKAVDVACTEASADSGMPVYVKATRHGTEAMAVLLAGGELLCETSTFTEPFFADDMRRLVGEWQPEEITDE